jgi:hypothetical protein
MARKDGGTVVMNSDTTGDDDDEEVGGGAVGDGKLEQRLESGGRGANESTMKGESTKSESRPLNIKKYSRSARRNCATDLQPGKINATARTGCNLFVRLLCSPARGGWVNLI